jgi:hypothetical protein
MKLSILATVAVLVLAGAATAQVIQGTERGLAPQSGFGPDAVQPLGWRWTNPQLWEGFNGSDRVRDPNLPGLLAADPRFKRPAADALRIAVPQMREACAADRQSMCSDKSSNLAADRCLEYHRLKLSKPCHQAWNNIALAAEGLL